MASKVVPSAKDVTVDASRLPKHVAVIMDGNGRWAKARHLPRIAGHRAGVESVRDAVRNCSKLGIPYLTLYSFSTENWSRPQDEVSDLMKLLALALKKEALELERNNVRLRAIGRLEALPSAVREELERSTAKLAKNTGLTLTLALNYGSRQELVDAVNGLIKAGASSVTEADIARALYTGGLPDPDLVIRTSGEMRVSNFLLWQIAYAELYVTPVLWPDFRREHLLEAVAEFGRRERRFGGV